MFKLISVTNRSLCREPFSRRMERVAASGVEAVLLREKDLSPAAYQALAAEVVPMCQAQGVACILHSHPSAALALGESALHLPLPLLRSLTAGERGRFSVLGASCHSLADVLEAAELGCTYVTLGHIFPTACKPGLPPRGLGLLEQVCGQSPIPVYAIGGIAPENVSAVRQAGAAGACLMGALMTCPDPAQLVEQLRKSLD